MTYLTNTDRDLLTFRPNINYVEPDQEPGVITPEPVAVQQLQDILAKKRKIARLARAVDLLSSFLQAKADQKAKNMYISLDPKHDAAAMQAVARRFPGTDTSRITYKQYRECKDKMREEGLKIAQQANVLPSQIEQERDNVTNIEKNLPGRFSNEKNKHGGLRPELDPNMTVFPSIDIPDMQLKLICILVDWIYKDFILKAFDFSIPLVDVSPADLLRKTVGERISVLAPYCEDTTDIDLSSFFPDFKAAQEVFTQTFKEIESQIPEEEQ